MVVRSELDEARIECRRAKAEVKLMADQLSDARGEIRRLRAELARAHVHECPRRRWWMFGH